MDKIWTVRRETGRQALARQIDQRRVLATPKPSAGLGSGSAMGTKAEAQARFDHFSPDSGTKSSGARRGSFDTKRSFAIVCIIPILRY